MATGLHRPPGRESHNAPPDLAIWLSRSYEQEATSWFAKFAMVSCSR